MMTGKNILTRVKNRWQLLRSIEILLFALGPAILVFLVSESFLASLVILLFLSLGIAVFIKPWKLSLQHICSYIDQKLEVVEYSSGLLLLPGESLTALARIQRHRITEKIKDKISDLKLKNNIKQAVSSLILFVLLGFLMSWLDVIPDVPNSRHNIDQKEIISFQPLDSLKAQFVPPVIVNQRLTINYPNYTNLATRTTTNMNAQALEGSRLTWEIEFDREVDSVFLEFTGETSSMNLKAESFVKTMVLKASGIYNFKFIDGQGNSFLSDLYALEMLKDQDPTIEIEGLKQFASFDLNEEKHLDFSARIADDHGLGEAIIIATVSKGAGESVKFREERLSFENRMRIGQRAAELSKRIDLDKLNMEPGDELYFYIAVADLKKPQPNTTRSETFFAVIKDTLSNTFAVQGSLGANLMPDYFRSQRQLIIDTEKLLANKAKMPKQAFNFTSNELGFDQKALRLKYGEFMGDEAELGVTESESTEETESTEEEDPLEEFTHDHDGDNEHNLVEEQGEDAEDPLQEYLHNHEDPEASTLFTQSLRSMLKQAMAEMWDAELYLRLFEPEKSLPYQYKALKLIQKIKNSARIYVHRIGFDPPPIKEEIRLTGDLEAIKTYQKKEELAVPESYPFMKQAATRLEQLDNHGDFIAETDKLLFKNAGIELSQLAIEHPGRYLKTLQQLKWLSESNRKTSIALKEVQRGLLSAIPYDTPKPEKLSGSLGEINELLLKELYIYDK